MPDNNHNHTDPAGTDPRQGSGTDHGIFKYLLDRGNKMMEKITPGITYDGTGRTTKGTLETCLNDVKEVSKGFTAREEYWRSQRGVKTFPENPEEIQLSPDETRILFSNDNSAQLKDYLARSRDDTVEQFISKRNIAYKYFEEELDLVQYATTL